MLCVNSNAYADPGSGSFIIQALIAFFGAIIIFLKNPIFFIKNFFVNLKNKFKKDQKDKKIMSTEINEGLFQTFFS